ncbi:MAG: hypothetical protein U9N35_05665 [Euryarchaeota archaeon]|nr:hypothetical protein [Euryarchaeota archaeon]
MKDLKRIGKDVEKFVLPKKNLSNFGMEWYRILNRVAEDPYGYLKEYFKRELSESYFGADKERIGRKIRPDGGEMACFGIAVLHNLFSVRAG